MKLSNLKLSFYFIPLIIVFILAFSGYSYFFNNNNRPTLIANQHKINLLIANTEVSREQGLSGRNKLNNNQGMLFVFNSPSQQYFWNQDMKFPIDVVWLNHNQVVGVGQLPIDTGQNITISSPGEVTQVLEVNSGQAQKFGLVLGQKISLKNIPYAN